MPATKRGIYHNLRESKYVISNTEVAFFFSSELYLNKFMDRYKENRISYANLLKNRNNPFNLDTVADIELYLKTEKRGFFARLKGMKISKDDLFKYYLRKMTENASSEWYRGR